jgi:septum formation protein
LKRDVGIASRAATETPALPLVLASGSPRRRAVLEQLGLQFEVVCPPPGTEWGWNRNEAPEMFARAVAEAKARPAARARPEAMVLAADTIVVLGGEVLGKPADPSGARAMLERLAGREHLVHTGVALIAPDGGTASGVETTTVAIRRLDPEEIAAYVATGEPLDKAGAYGIQGLGAALVDSVRGCYFNVMGLPVGRMLALLGELGCAYVWPGSIVRR